MRTLLLQPNALAHISLQYMYNLCKIIPQSPGSERTKSPRFRSGKPVRLYEGKSEAYVSKRSSINIT